MAIIFGATGKPSSTENIYVSNITQNFCCHIFEFISLYKNYSNIFQLFFNNEFFLLLCDRMFNVFFYKVYIRSSRVIDVYNKLFKWPAFTYIRILRINFLLTRSLCPLRLPFPTFMIRRKQTQSFLHYFKTKLAN